MQSPSATEAAAATVHVALVGNPNTGKSTLFNTLTGYHQRVGNFPGVTVELKIGEVRGSATDSSMQLVDLPGSYSLHAESADEAILLDVLIGDRSGLPKPDALLCVIDACHLRRNLFLVTQVIELGLPVVVALNMTDIAASRGVSIDVDVLRDRLGVPVVPIVATRDSSVRPLLDALQQVVANGQVPADRPLLPQDVRNCGAQLAAGLAGDAALKDELGEQAKQGPVPGGPRAAALEITQALLAPKGFMEQRLITKHGPSILDRLSEQREVLERAHGAVVEIEAQSRYAWIDEVVQSSVQDGASRGRSRSDLADKWLTHRVWGLLVFLVLMAICFQAVYSWSGPFMDFIDGCFAWVGGSLASMVPEGALQSLLTDGVVAGVGGVLIFLPQILILFLFIAILEDCGYMARVAFLLDRWMGWVGLSGRSFVPLISSFACAIPGILATRTIEDRRSRYATMLIAPLMSCSARLPVYVLLISTFVPAQSYLGGWLGLQALVMLALYAVGVVAAIFVAWILNRTMLKGRAPSFLMELPSYKWPSVRTVFFRLYEQGREFCISAGTIIFATTIIIWALGYYPRSTTIMQDHAALRVEAEQIVDAGAKDERLAEIDRLEAGANLRNSMLGRAGAWVEPLVQPLGWDWRIGTAAIASFPAREVVIATLGTIYNLGGDTDESSSVLREKLKSATYPDGRLVFSLPVALSIMVFFALCCQCAATLAVIKRETRQWRWAVFTFVYMTGLAYVASLVTYQAASRIIG